MKPQVHRSLLAGQILAHFTRASTAASALDNLASILAEGRIRASSRMIAGRQPVVCLFDATLAQLAQLLGPGARRRYQPCGLALNRYHAFAMGARPVIYLPVREARRLLPGNEMWRVVSLEPDGRRGVDWTFEREWRIAGDLPFVPSDIIALVGNWQEVDAIYQRFDGRPPCAGVLPLKSAFEQP